MQYKSKVEFPKDKETGKPILGTVVFHRVCLRGVCLRSDEQS